MITSSAAVRLGYAFPREGLSDDHARNEERYALAIESINYGVYDWNIEAGVVHYSPVLRDMLGFAANERATPEGWMHRIHPDDRAQYRRALVGHLKGELPRFETEVRYRIDDGSWRWARLHGLAVRGPDGRARRLVGATRDITEIKQRARELQAARAAAALRAGQSSTELAGRSEERYALALESINENIYDWDLESGRLYFSPGLRMMLGLTPDEPITLDQWAAFIHPVDLPAHRRMLVAHLKGETPRFECEFRYSTGDGTWRWARQHGIALRNQEGRAHRIVGATGDITAAKERERELLSAKAEVAAVHRDIEHARELMEIMLNNMTHGVVLIGEDLTLISCNRRFQELLELPPGIVDGKRRLPELARYLTQRGEYGDVDVDAQVARIVADISRQNTYERTRPDGTILEVRHNTIPGGGFLSIFSDVTDRKRVEQSIRQSEQRLRTMLESSPIGAAISTEDGRLLFCNSEFAEQNGFRLEERESVDLVSLFVEPDDRRRIFQQFRRDGTGRNMQVERRRIDGTRWWSLYSMDGIEYEGERALLSWHYDITELKEREEALSAAKEGAELARAEAEQARAEAEQARTEAERMRNVMSTVLANMSDGVTLFDKDFNWLFSNRRHIERSEYPPQFLVPGVTGFDLIRFQAERGEFGPVDDVEQKVRDLAALIRRPDGSRYERRTKNGRYIEFTYTPLEDGGVLGLYRDITDLKDREEALAAAKVAAEAARDEAAAAQRRVERAQTLMQVVLDNMSGGFMLFDKDFHLQLVNRALVELQKYPVDLMEPGTSGYDIMRFQVERGDFGPVEDIDAAVSDRVAMVLDPASHRYVRRTASGRYIEFNFKRLPDGGHLTVGIDVTELKRAQEVMQIVLDNMGEGVSLFDETGHLRFINQPLIEMQGYSPEVARPGTSVYDLVRNMVEGGQFGPVDDVEAFVRARGALVLTPGGNHFERRTPSGQHLEYRIRQIDDGGFLAVGRDITELKDREVALAAAKDAAESARDAAERERAEAEAANQAKSTFLATMSHEIRTPMNGVLGMMEVLERQGLSGEQRRTVATMRDSALSLLRIIDDLLDFSKIEAGRLELEDTAFSLSELIEGVVGTFKLQAHDKGLALTTEIATGSHDALIGDSTRVRQILFNLVGNALKFTNRGGVTVRAATAALGGGQTQITLAVADTGIGLDDAQRARLFQPFSQGDSSTTRRFGGTGLGLSIVRRLAQLMGGDVTVASAPNAGSTFTVTVKLRAAPADSLLNTTLRLAAPTGASNVPARPRMQMRVLVADDHPVNREVLVRQLELLGLASDTVADGVEALMAWSSGGYAAVLADIHMPRMDGHELTRALRRAEAERGSSAPRTPVIAVTANAMKGEEEHCLAVGMDAYLAKPVRIEQLRATLERWLPIADDSGAPEHQAYRSGNGKAIDRSVLAAWLGDDRAAIDSLLAKFRDTAIQSEQEIDAASRAGDLVALAAAAHKLKGAAQAVGATRIGQIAATLERAGKAGDRPRCRDELGPLAAEMRRALAEIDGGGKQAG
jgi:PAS domain S-box-containing protein